jgi:hypothetical protein
MILHILIAMIAGWVQRHQQQVIAYLQEENRVLKVQLGGRRLRLSDTERRRLTALAHPVVYLAAADNSNGPARRRTSRSIQTVMGSPIGV